MKRLEQTFEKKHGTEISAQPLAEQLKIFTSELDGILQICQVPRSLNAPYANNKETSDNMLLEDYIPDNLTNVVDQVCKSILRDDIIFNRFSKEKRNMGYFI